MPRITSFMYCAQSDLKENRVKIDTPLHIISIKYLPTLFSFSVVFALTEVDSEEDHYLKFKFLNNEEEILIDTGLLVIEKEPQEDSNALQGMMGSIRFNNIELKEVGMYKTEIFFDDDKIAEFPIPVVTEKGGRTNDSIS